MNTTTSSNRGAWFIVLKGGLLLLKVAVAAFLLWWLGIFSNATLIGLRSAGRAPGLVAGALMMALGSIHLGWVRWHLLLHAGGAAILRRHSYRVNYASAFFGLFLPGNSGLDVTRLAYAWRGDPGTRSCLAGSVLVDRGMGFVGLLCACNLATLAVRCVGISSPVVIGFAYFGLAGLVAAVGALALLPSLARWIGRRSGRWAPERAAQFVRRLADTFAAYRMRIPTLALCAALSCAGVMLTGASLWLLLHALGAGQVSAVALGFATPYSALANMLPITPGGLGIGESSFAALYGMAGGTSAGALLASAFLAYRILYLLASLPGLFVWLFGRGSLSLSQKHQSTETLEDV